MRLSRRHLLRATLGATQTALLARTAAPKLAWGQTNNGPTKLLTLFLGGGWQSPWAFVPFSDTEVGQIIPTPHVKSGEPCYFTASDLVNLDGSSGATGALRLPRLWDQTALAAGMPDPRTGGATSPNGWSWVQNQLWQNAMVVHGVDQMTVAHVGGTISALTGVASSEFKSPALNAYVADALSTRFPDRPLPSVWISGPAPESPGLKATAAPARITQASDLKFLYSDQLAGPWTNLHAADVMSNIAPLGFDGSPIANAGFVLNPIEDRVARRLRAMKGTLNPASEGVLQQLYDGLSQVSRVLAKDVTSMVQATQGVQYSPVPFWGPSGGGHFAVDVPGFKNDSGSTWAADFDLALRLLKSDVCSAVGVSAQAPQNASWDNGHAEGHEVQFVQVRAMLEVIGQLLGEMKATPGKTAGKSLLDETLVVVISDFARTWPNSAPSSDHWASNSVIFAGGGINTNRMLGGYVVGDPNATGFLGQPIDVAEVTGTVNRVPRSADIVTTACAVLGVTGIRISGGNGEILGVRQGT